MKLQEIFDQLSYGELSQVSIGGAPMGEITEDNYKRVLGHINLGLLALYRRFNLKEGQLLLRLIPGQLEYQIHSSFVEGNRKSRELVRYLTEDASDPFKDELLKIERVFTELDVELPLNLNGDVYSVKTPSSARLWVPLSIVNRDNSLPEGLRTDTLRLVYRASHPMLVIPMGLFDPTRIEIQLPESHLEALLYFISARVNTTMGLDLIKGKLGNELYGRYENECARLEQQNLQIDKGAFNTRLQRGGWV